MTRRAHSLVTIVSCTVGLLLASAAWSPRAQAFETEDGTYFTVDVLLSGGIVMEWANPDQAGNTFGLTVGFDWAYFRVALGVSGVLPASNVEGAHEAVWVEAWGLPFAPLIPDSNAQPYVVVGVGVLTADAIDTPRAPDQIPPPAVRWSPRNPRLLGMLGVGVTYGDVQGMFVAFDFRAYNHTHGGFNLSAGYRF